MKDVLSISRSNDRTLLDYDKQEEYFKSYIKESSGEAKLFKIRKLREGIIASRRIDEFAVCIYEISVDECITQGNFSELIRSLSGLLRLYKDYPSERVTEMKLYLILYLYCFNNPNLYDITKQIENHDIPIEERAVKFIRSLNLNDYHMASEHFFAMSDKERILARTCIPRIRPIVMKMLTRSYFTLHCSILTKYLLIEDDSELLNILPFGIGEGGICELKMKKVKS